MKILDPAFGIWRWVVGGAVFFLLLMVLAGLMAVSRALRTPEETARQAQGPAGTEPRAAVLAPESAAARPDPAGAVAENAAMTDLEVVRAREEGRRELIDNLRRQAAENPDSSATLSPEEIRQLEISGASLM